ncbi:MAG TPA: RlmE family RNA methyltransferase [Candidatus Acidoferrales bacterium]|nr:RlmE family RNA methyltransferase [Candidatus Acidoferrales bacterium]
MPSEWLRQRSKDQFHRLAMEKGFRSRASFKLLQITRRYHFIKPGQRVLDLGAAPGGWLQAARQVVGTRGFVFGVDLQPITALPHTNIQTMIGDITKPEIVDEIKKEAGLSFDVVLSDLAPNVSGVWEVDHARQIELARCAVRVGGLVMRGSGNMLVKVFQGSEVKAFQDEMRSMFSEFRIVKPQASRPESAELYFLGLGFVGEGPE